ncbi:MAG: hypothetical protein HY089_01100 [Ignavibacteriales bacterium]|nr:hypothetical protein [Ignavibacteriales bacterium]
MKCPKCGNEQPDIFSQCQKCRYIFRKISVAEASRPLTDPVATQNNYPPPPETRPISLISGSAVLLVLFSAALWWLYTPEGSSVPEGSFINTRHRFAITPPSGWITLSPENYDEMFRLYGTKFQENLRQGLTQRKIENGFMKILPEGEFSPSVNIVVVQGEMPPLDGDQKEEAAKAISGEFAKTFDAYTLDEKELVEIDELTSLRLVSKASVKFLIAESKPIYKETIPGWRTVTGHTPAEWKTYNLKFIQTLVPGKKKGFIITCTAEANQFAQYKSAFEHMIDSFHVIERPPRFGPIMMGGIQSGLIGGIIFLLYYFATGILRLLRR